MSVITHTILYNKKVNCQGQLELKWEWHKNSTRLVLVWNPLTFLLLSNVWVVVFVPIT